MRYIIVVRLRRADPCACILGSGVWLALQYSPPVCACVVYASGYSRTTAVDGFRAATELAYLCGATCTCSLHSAPWPFVLQSIFAIGSLELYPNRWAIKPSNGPDIVYTEYLEHTTRDNANRCSASGIPIAIKKTSCKMFTISQSTGRDPPSPTLASLRSRRQLEQAFENPRCLLYPIRSSEVTR